MSKLWVASKSVLPEPLSGYTGDHQHTYLVYDPDGNPNSGDELIWRGGPDTNPNEPDDIPLLGDMKIENWVPINSSDDRLNGLDPFSDRNYTEVDTGTQTPEQVKDKLRDFAENLGVDEGTDGTASDIPYTVPRVNFDNDTNSINLDPALNSNTTVKSGLDSAGIDFNNNLPIEGGAGSGGSRIPLERFPGAESNYSGQGGEHDIDPNLNQVFWNVDGDNTYVIDVNPFGTGQAVIIEDGNTSTTDKIEINGVDPSDIRFSRLPNGDLEIYFPWNADGEPAIKIKGQWDEDDVPRMNTVWVDPADGSAPVAIPLNNPENFPLDVATPLFDLPQWLDDLLDDWGGAKDTGSPLVLDLDGQGVDLASVLGTDAVYWDIDLDGLAEKSGWISGNDGLLAIDLNSDGVINDHAELFGSLTTDGFSVLSAYDSNTDNVIDVNDTQFGDLLVWVDSNSDGYSQSGELFTLTDLGITSINLNASLVDYDIAGNHVTHESTFTINGQTQTIVDAWFAYDNVNSHYQESYTLDFRTMYLPTLRGFGDVKDLHIAMSMDETLLLMMQEIAVADAATLFDLTFDLNSKIEAMLYRWAGVDGVDPNSRGGYVDARQLEFFEKYLGDEYLEYEIYENPGVTAGNIVTGMFDSLAQNILPQILVQTAASSFFNNDVFYNAATGQVENFNLDEINFLTLNQIMNQTTDTSNAYVISDINSSYVIDENNGGGYDEIWIQGVEESELRFVKVGFSLEINIGSETITVVHQFKSDNYLNNSYDYYQIENIVLDDGTKIDLLNDLAFTGTSGNDVLLGLNADDIIIGAEGDDDLRGSYGNDTYVWSIGDGNDIISESGGSDTLILHGMLLSGVSFVQSGNNLSINIGSETITVESYFVTSNDYKVENVVFDDGSTVDLIDYFNTAPIAQDDDFSGEQDLDITGNLLGDNGHGIDSDPDGDALNVVSGTYATLNGSIVISANGDFVYTPTTGYVGTDSFTYTLEDGLGKSDTGSMTLTVSLPNQNTNVINGTSGDDYLYGDQSGVSNDTLVGGAGNDGLYGYAGNDSYVWSVGDGNDTIDETGGLDEIVLHGVLESEISFEKYNTYHLKINIGTESITVNGQYYSEVWGNSQDVYRVETLRLDDGTVIDLLGGLTFTGTSGNETLNGSYGDDILFGLGGDDYLYASQGNDTLEGGAGNDGLYGEAGNDSYVWTVGDGNDTIDETGGLDEIVLHGVLESEISFEKYNTYHLKIHVGGESITVNAQYYSEVWGSSQDVYRVETLRLDDGTVIDLLGGLTFTGTSGNEILYGSHGDDVLFGLGGDDTLYASQGNDTLEGGTGNDGLYGEAGNDSYVWSMGDGNDTIDETGGLDEIILHGVLESEISFEKYNTHHLKISIGDDSITVNGQYYSESWGSSQDVYRVETLRLDDGTVIDLLSGLTFTGTSVGDTLNGSHGNDVLIGLGGSDSLYASNGDDLLYGGDGQDYLYGQAGADTFVFESASVFNNVEIIGDFSLVDGDKIDVSDVLIGYDPLTDAISDFVQITDSGVYNSELAIDADGGGDNFVIVASLYSITGITDEGALETSSNLITV